MEKTKHRAGRKPTRCHGVTNDRFKVRLRRFLLPIPAKKSILIPRCGLRPLCRWLGTRAGVKERQLLYTAAVLFSMDRIPLVFSVVNRVRGKKRARFLSDLQHPIVFISQKTESGAQTKQSAPLSVFFLRTVRCQIRNSFSTRSFSFFSSLYAVMSRVFSACRSIQGTPMSIYGFRPSMRRRRTTEAPLSSSRYRNS